MLIGDIITAPRVADYVDGAAQMMFCDGRAVNRITYATLFGLCGVQFGAGDGLTTFNIPNFVQSGGMDGRMPVGARRVAPGYVLGAAAGVQQHDHANVGVTVPHGMASPDTAPGGNWLNAMVGVTAYAPPGHVHSMPGAPADHAGLANVDVAVAQHPFLAIGFFVRAL